MVGAGALRTFGERPRRPAADLDRGWRATAVGHRVAPAVRVAA
ncbi:hypothetical protein [Halorussus salinus]|nr:hypothetical protein [Halorussus salinus]